MDRGACQAAVDEITEIGPLCERRSEHKHKMLKEGKEKTLSGGCKPIRL